MKLHNLQPTQQPILALAALAVAAVATGWVAVSMPTMLYGVLALPLALVALVYLKRPHWALYTFIFGLPIHSLLITLLIAQFDTPPSMVRLVAAWKELLLLGSFAAAVLYTLLHKAPSRFTTVDAVALAWFCLIASYFVLHPVLFGWEVSLVARLYGAREWLLYLLPYFAGRMIAVPRHAARSILTAIVLAGLATSLIGIVEVWFVPTMWHVYLGVPQYFGGFLNLQYPAYLNGLPPNYWTEFGGTTVRRAVSTYLSGQGFAIPFLVVFPVVVYNYLVKMTRFSSLIVLLCGLALVLTITRMTIMVCALQGLLLLLKFGRRRLLIQLLTIGLLGGVLLIAASPSIQTFITKTVLLQDTSSKARPRQWAEGFRALFEQPFGQGLGYSGQVGARFGVSGAGSEAGYFKIFGDLGLLGLLLFLAWFAGIIRYARRGFRSLPGHWSGLAVVTLAVAIGFLLNNLTAPPDQVPFVMYIFPWLAGLTVQQVVWHTMPTTAETVTTTPNGISSAAGTLPGRHQQVNRQDVL